MQFVSAFNYNIQIKNAVAFSYKSNHFLI